MIAGVSEAASETADQQSVRGMEPTGIEPVTSCLQSSFSDDLKKARKRLKSRRSADPEARPG